MIDYLATIRSVEQQQADSWRCPVARTKDWLPDQVTKFVPAEIIDRLYHGQILVSEQSKMKVHGGLSDLRGCDQLVDAVAEHTQGGLAIGQGISGVSH